MKAVSSAKCFGGLVKQFKHQSRVLNCEMTFSVFLPPQAAEEGAAVPVLYWLSGLTCTDQNFITKAGAQRAAAKHGLMLVVPDTSPRGCNIPGETDAWDFGAGAGFYVNATEAKWKEHYNMYAYVTDELPALVGAGLPADRARASIFGHSMGGHGALVCALRNPGMYRSVSAFAPICNPTRCAWGRKAFAGYLGPDEARWREYDATELVRGYAGPQLDILIDQGSEDGFLQDQLRPQSFVDACREAGVSCALRMQEGYDHSYYFISTFIDDHVAHHARYLKA